MRPSRVRWRILGLMFIGSAVAYVLRLNVSIAGDAMIRDLSLTPVQFGLILSAFAWGYAVFQLPGGLLGEWLGPRRALTLVIGGWGVLTLAMALLPASGGAAAIVGSAMVLRLLMGMLQAPIFPITSGCSVRTWFPLRSWAMPNALLTVGTTIGGVIAGPVVAWLVVWLGWRGAFLAMAPLGFIGAALWWWYSRDEPAKHPHVNEAELALIRSDPPPPVPEERGALRSVLLNRDVMLLTASYAATGYVFYLFFNWFFFYVDVAYWVAAMIVGGRHASAATGLMNTGGNAAGAIGAVAVPLIARSAGWFVAVSTGAAFALLAAALWLWIVVPARARAPEAEASPEPVPA